MAGSLVRARFARKSAQDDDRRAGSSISISSPRWSAGRRPGRPKHMPEAPILVLLASSAASPGAADVPRGPDRDPIILGLSLIQRAALAARRAGYGGVLPSAQRLRDARGRRDRRLARSRRNTRPHYGALIIAPAVILAETDWLERLASTRIAPAAWAAIPNRIVMLPAASALAAVGVLGRDGGTRELAAVERRLGRLFRPPTSLSADIAPMVVETPADVRDAEGRLLRSLVKDTDGLMARHVERPISLQISRRLAGTRSHPIKQA